MSRYTLLLSILVAFLTACGAPSREAFQITRILEKRCQQSAVEDEQCESEENQQQRLPAIIEWTSTEQVFLSIADVNNGNDLSYAGTRTNQNLHFVAQQQRLDPETNCQFNRIDEINLHIDADLIEGSQSIRVEQSAACTTTGWSLLTRQDWLWRGHRLDLARPDDAASPITN